MKRFFFLTSTDSMLDEENVFLVKLQNLLLKQTDTTNKFPEQRGHYFSERSFGIIILRDLTVNWLNQNKASGYKSCNNQGEFWNVIAWHQNLPWCLFIAEKLYSWVWDNTCTISTIASEKPSKTFSFPYMLEPLNSSIILNSMAVLNLYLSP